MTKIRERRHIGKRYRQSLRWLDSLLGRRSTAHTLFPWNPIKVPVLRRRERFVTRRHK